MTVTREVILFLLGVAAGYALLWLSLYLAAGGDAKEARKL